MYFLQVALILITICASLNYEFAPFSALTLLAGWQEWLLSCKKLDVGLLVVTFWLELCTSYSSSCYPYLKFSTILICSKFQNADILVLANPDPSGNMAFKMNRQFFNSVGYATLAWSEINRVVQRSF